MPKRIVRQSWSLLLALLIAACNNLDAPSDNSDASCTITISGAAAIAGSYTCTSAPITLYVPNTNTGAVNISVAAAKTISGVFVFLGQPIAGQTYTSSNSAGLQSYGMLVTNGAASWEFSAGAQAAPLGSGSLTFTSVSGALVGTTSTIYSAHGTLDANLVPTPGTTASGNATMHVTF